MPSPLHSLIIDFILLILNPPIIFLLLTSSINVLFSKFKNIFLKNHFLLKMPPHRDHTADAALATLVQQMTAAITDFIVQLNNNDNNHETNQPQCTHASSNSSIPPQSREPKPSRNKRKRKTKKHAINTPPIPSNKSTHVGQSSNKKVYMGNFPLCDTCERHHPHNAPCRLCVRCGRFGHMTTTCRAKPLANQTPQNNQPPIVSTHPDLTCSNCGNPSHSRNQCPKLAITILYARGNASNLM